jgi:hypothetical protein
MKEIVLMNLLITTISFLFISYLYYKYYFQLKIDGKRYKLFELRDKLAILVVQNNINTNSKEYFGLYLILMFPFLSSHFCKVNIHIIV